MDANCISINDLILEYANNTISKKNNNILLNHLVLCGECRKELVVVLSLAKSVQYQSIEIPEHILVNAFSLITEEDVQISNTSFAQLKSSLGILKHALLTTKKSIKLAIQFI